MRGAMSNGPGSYFKKSTQVVQWWLEWGGKR
jgi:hypothetical protein